VAAATPGTATASIATVGNHSVNSDSPIAAAASCASQSASTTGSPIATAAASDE